MRRLFLAANFLSEVSGSKSVMEDLADQLRARGWKLVCASSFRAGIFRALHMLSAAVCFRSSYNLAMVDVFSGRAFLWAEALSYLLVLLRRPFILALHGGALPEFASRHPARVKNCLKKANTAVVPSAYLLDQMKLYRQDLFLIPNAIDLPAYDFKLRENPKRSLVWLRAFHEIYNPSLAVEVLALLLKDFPDIHLTMIGPDKGDGSLARAWKLAGQLDVAGRIHFSGPVSKKNVPRRLSEADIFLNTANIDNTPVSVLEAMASGLCVVSTNVGGIPYLLEHEKDSLLVPPNHPEAMAAAVRKILNDPSLAARLSSSARKKAEQFDWSKVLAQWEALIMKTAGVP